MLSFLQKSFLIPREMDLKHAIKAKNHLYQNQLYYHFGTISCVLLNNSNFLTCSVRGTVTIVFVTEDLSVVCSRETASGKVAAPLKSIQNWHRIELTWKFKSFEISELKIRRLGNPKVEIRMLDKREA